MNSYKIFNLKNLNWNEELYNFIENLFLYRSVIFVEKYRRVMSNAIQLTVWNYQVIGGTIISFSDRLPREQKLKANWLFMCFIF